MWVLASTTEDIVTLLPLVIGIVGLGGLVFTALRFRRDDTTAVVNQQNVILDDMKKLNDELRTTVSDLRTERDELRAVAEPEGLPELPSRGLFQCRP